VRRRVESGVLASPDLSETVPLFVHHQLNSDAQIPQVEGLTLQAMISRSNGIGFDPDVI